MRAGTVFLLVWCCMLGPVAWGQAGSLDRSFPAGPGPDGPVRDLVELPDGRLLAAGDFSTWDGLEAARVARLFPDGRLDPSFRLVLNREGLLPPASSLLLGSDGGIFVEFARLHTHGSLDLRLAPEVVGTEFSVSAGGPGAIAYWWQRSGLDLPLQTNAVLRLPDFQAADAGEYRAIASNADGSITSTVATLTVMPAIAPAVAVEVLRVQASPGSSPVLRATVSGRPAPAIQWYRGGVPVAGATQAVWTVTNVRATDAGVYHVDAANPLGRAMGPEVTLQVSAESPFPGRVDVGFLAPGITGIRALAVDSAGRVLVGGTFQEIAGVPRRGVARLFPDGHLDPGFDAGSGPLGGQPICCPDAEFLMAGTVMALATLPDDRVYVGGNFTTFAGRAAGGLVRLRTDGGLDEAFPAETNGVRGSIGPVVLTLMTETDGSVVGGGYFTEPTPRLARWLIDGRVDADFHPGTGATEGAGFQKADVPFPMFLDGTHVRTLARLPGGRILAAGNFTKFDGELRGGLAQLTSDGRVDPTFVPGPAPGLARAVGVDIAGRVYVGWERPGAFQRPGSGWVERLDANGQRDPGFAPVSTDSRVTALVVQRDGAVIIAGSFTQVNGVVRRGIARLLPNGVLDDGFSLGEDGLASGDHVLALQDDGSVLVAGGFEGFHGVPRVGLARLLGGSVPAAPPVLIHEPVDVALREGGTAVFSVVAASGGNPTFHWLREGESIAGADRSTLSLVNVRLRQAGEYAVAVSNAWGGVTSRRVRLAVEPGSSLPGSVDLEFDPTRTATPGGTPVVLSIDSQTDGRLLLTGLFTNGTGLGSSLDRWSPEAAPDSSPAFPIALDAFPSSVLIQPADGRILVAPTGIGITPTNGFGITRFLPDGRVDPGFQVRIGPGSTEIRAAALEAEGSVLVGGTFLTLQGASQPYLGRVSAAGSRDPGFAPRVGAGSDPAYPPVSQILVQPDGRILVGGSFRFINQVERLAVARLLTNGQLDSGFVLRSAPDLVVSAMALDARGRILVAFLGAAGQSQVLGRWQPDGTRDFSFRVPLLRGPSGVGSPAVRVIVFDGHERVVIGGDFEAGNAARPFRNVARLLSDGPLDVEWNVSPGANSAVLDLQVTPGDGVYLVGSFTEVQDIPRRGIARLLGEASAMGPRLEAPTVGAGILRFTVSTRSGHRYAVEVAGAVGGAWVPTGEPVLGDGTPRVLSVPVPEGLGQRFARVRED